MLSLKDYNDAIDVLKNVYPEREQFEFDEVVTVLMEIKQSNQLQIATELQQLFVALMSTNETVNSANDDHYVNETHSILDNYLNRLSILKAICELIIQKQKLGITLNEIYQEILKKFAAEFIQMTDANKSEIHQKTQTLIFGSDGLQAKGYCHLKARTLHTIVLNMEKMFDETEFNDLLSSKEEKEEVSELFMMALLTSKNVPEISQSKKVEMVQKENYLLENFFRALCKLSIKCPDRKSFKIAEIFSKFIPDYEKLSANQKKNLSYHIEQLGKHDLWIDHGESYIHSFTLNVNANLKILDQNLIKLFNKAKLIISKNDNGQLDFEKWRIQYLKPAFVLKVICELAKKQKFTFTSSQIFKKIKKMTQFEPEKEEIAKAKYSIGACLIAKGSKKNPTTERFIKKSQRPLCELGYCRKISKDQYLFELDLAKPLNPEDFPRDDRADLPTQEDFDAAIAANIAYLNNLIPQPLEGDSLEITESDNNEMEKKSLENRGQKRSWNMVYSQNDLITQFGIITTTNADSINDQIESVNTDEFDFN